MVRLIEVEIETVGITDRERGRDRERERKGECMVGTECECLCVCVCVYEQLKPVCKTSLSLSVNLLSGFPIWSDCTVALHLPALKLCATAESVQLVLFTGMSPIVKSPECTPVLCHCKVACTNNTLSLMFGCKVGCRPLSLLQRNMALLTVAYFEQ